jgi:NAD(P)-dependent dehydrogenase (short-subunit alcohol dehydrogenase family)
LDILISNARIAHIGNVTYTTTEDLDRIYSVNVKGVFNCIKVGIESMKAKGGSIINISSIAAHVVFPDLASIKSAFPQITDQYLGNDVAYPAMLTRLTPGWLGLVIASLIAAYMSTIGTSLLHMHKSTSKPELAFRKYSNF